MPKRTALKAPPKKRPKRTSIPESSFYQVWVFNDQELSQFYEMNAEKLVQLAPFLDETMAHYAKKGIDAVVLTLQFDVDTGEFATWHVVSSRRDGRLSKTLKAMISSRIREQDPNFTPDQLRRKTRALTSG